MEDAPGGNRLMELLERESRRTKVARDLKKLLARSVEEKVLSLEKSADYQRVMAKFNEIVAGDPVRSFEDWAPTRPYKNCEEEEVGMEKKQCISKSMQYLLELKDALTLSNQLLTAKNRKGGLDLMMAMEDVGSRANEALFAIKGLVSMVSSSKSSILAQLTQQLARTLLVYRQASQQMSRKKDQLAEIMTNTRSAVTQAMQQSNEVLTARKRQAKTQLEGYMRDLLRTISAQSKEMNKDAATTVRSLETQFRPAYLRSVNRGRQVADLAAEFQREIAAKTKRVAVELPEKIKDAERVMVKTAKAGAETVNVQLPGFTEKMKAGFNKKVDSYIEQYNNRVQQFQQTQSGTITRFRGNQDRLVNAMTRSLTKNITAVEKAAYAVMKKVDGEVIDPVIRLFNQTQRNVQAANNQFRNDADLSMVDAKKLLNETVQAFTAALSQFETDWDQARIASAGDFGALSSDFMNRLGSVGAATQQEVANIHAEGDAEKTAVSDSIANQKTLMEASMGDVDRYMGGSAVHMGDEVEAMKELLLEKKQEVEAVSKFLANFLMGRVEKGARTFEEAIAELGNVIYQMSNETNNKTGGKFSAANSGKSEVEKNKELMNQQLNALMMSADVKGEALQELLAAADSGDKQLFDKFFAQMTSQNEALAAAVDKNLELASITAALASETDGARRQFLSERLRKMVADSGTQLELLRGQITGQITSSRGSLNSLSGKNLKVFERVASEAISSAQTLSQIPGATREVQEAIGRLIAPLVVRMDTLRKQLVPFAVQRMSDAAFGVKTVGNRTLADFAAAADLSINHKRTEMEDFGGDLRQTVEDGVNAGVVNLDTALVALANDTTEATQRLPDLETQLHVEVEALKGLATQTALKLDELRRAQIVEQLKHFVQTSLEQEETRMGLLSPEKSMIVVEDKINRLFDSSNKSIDSLEKFFFQVQEPIVDKLKADAKHTKEVTDNFTSIVKSWDLEDIALVKDMVSNELASITHAWKVLQSIAPVVNVNLAAVMKPDLSKKLGAALMDLSKVEAATAAAYQEALTTTSAVDVSKVVDTIFDAIENNFDKSKSLQDKVYSGYAANDLYSLASVLQSVGGGVGAVGEASGNMTREGVNRALAVSENANGEKIAALNIKEVSGDSVKALLQAFLARKLAVDETMDEEQRKLLGQKASLEGVVKLWGELFGSAISTTKTGFENAQLLQDAVFDGLDALELSDKEFVEAKMKSGKEDLKKIMKKADSFKTVQDPVVDRLQKRFVEISESINELVDEVPRKNNEFQAEITKQENKDSKISADFTTAIDNWFFDIKRAVDSDLATITV